MDQTAVNGSGFHPRRWKPGIELTPGAWIGVPSEVYHSLEAVSRSLCVNFCETTPADAFDRWRSNIDEPTLDMIFGLAVESYVMDHPDEFRRKFKVQAGRAGSKAYEAQAEEFPDAYLVTQERYDRIVGAGRSLLAHPFVGALIEGATHKHLVLIWHHEDTGLLCKAQLDFFCEGFGLVWDLKTTGSVTDHAIEQMFSQNRMLFQPPFYLAGLQSVGLTFDNFGFVIVSRDARANGQHPIRLKMYSDEDLAHGMRELGLLPGIKGVLHDIANCVEANDWPDYEQEFTFAAIKNWKRRELEGEETNEQ